MVYGVNVYSSVYVCMSVYSYIGVVASMIRIYGWEYVAIGVGVSMAVCVYFMSFSGSISQLY